MLRSTSQSNKLRTKAKVMNEGLVRSLGEFPSYWGGDGVVLGTPTRSMFSHVVSSNLAVQVNERQAKLEVSFYHYCCLRGARVVSFLEACGFPAIPEQCLPIRSHHGWPRVAVRQRLWRSLWMKWDQPHTDLCAWGKFPKDATRRLSKAKPFLRKKDCEALVNVASFNDVTAVNDCIMIASTRASSMLILRVCYVGNLHALKKNCYRIVHLGCWLLYGFG